MNFKLAIKNILHNKTSALAIVITIALCCFIIFFSLIYNQMVLEEFRTNQSVEAENADIKIEYSSQSDTRIINTAPLQPYINNLEYAVGVLDVFGIAEFKEEQFYVNLIGTKANDELLLNNLNYIQTLNRDLKKDEIIISKKASEERGLKLNSSVKIRVGNNQKTFYVAKIADNHPALENNGFDVFYGRENYVSEFFIGIGYGNFYNKIFIKANSYTDIESLIEDLSDISEYQGYNITIANDDGDIIWSAKTFALFVNIAIYVCLALAVLMLFLIMNAGLKKRIFTISQLKGLGASNSYILRMFLIENLIYIIVGSVIAIFINNYLLKYIIPNIMSINPQRSFYINRIYIAVAINSILALLMMFVPILKTRKITIRKAYVLSKHTLWKGNILFLILGLAMVIAAVALIIPYYLNFIRGILSLILCLLGMIIIAPYIVKYLSKLFFKITQKGICYAAVKNLYNERGNANNSRILVAGVITCTVIISSIMMVGQTYDNIYNNIECDIIAQNIDSSNNNQLNKIKATDGIYNVNPVLMRETDVAYEIRDINTKVLGITSDSIGLLNSNEDILSDEELKSLIDDGEGVVIDYIFHKSLNYNIGDTLTLTVNNITKEVEIVGYFQSSLLNWRIFLLNNELMSQLFELPLYNSVFCQTHNDIDDSVVALRAELGGHNTFVVNKHTLFKSYMQALENLIELSYYFTLFLFVVCLIGIITNIINSRDSRKFSYYQMYSLGFSKSRIMITDLIENSVNFFVAAVLSAISFVIINKANINIFSINIMYLSKAITLQSIFLVMGIFAFLLFILSLSAFWIVNDKKLIKTLKINS